MIQIRIMGGLGNQMFQYAMLRVQTLEYGEKGVMDLSGLTNKTHNVYVLNNLNIFQDIQCVPKSNRLRAKLNYLIYGYYFVFLQKNKNGFKRLLKIQKFFQPFGMYCIPDGYAELKKCKTTNKYFIGYFTSSKYFKEYEDIIRKELKVKTEIFSKNIKVLKQIKASNSVCIHLRRGDYVGSSFQVCTDKYYLDAINKMKKLVKSPKFFIFSDDIPWVKDHFQFPTEREYVYMDQKNPNYEDLRLMYNCKHFIISNSTFSWWAQFLSENKEKIVIAPNIWYHNPNIKCDIYEENWIKMPVEESDNLEKKLKK